uniref:Uncharacterized protein n=1 Tax=Chromera velia CCMP2878 TaxID=1169474 RepID=A0A0K6S768_9ALVE|eukprot:Cvel_18605.t1-p1 / transcript=Cvel_18605.t1 / gene=Cvel_18605 / organism=Chromera_velia_CCMP2878 / gene_product=hypothetical protein / transcript_product=hypothetical protein / location=Cvel_scaffold1552:25737-28290(+) / protein_length=152 / sequence_SO=supercontig / SO=protein_coding / is_pseudo=false
MRCDIRSSVCSRLSPRHEGPCVSPKALFGLSVRDSSMASNRARCCPSPVLVLPTGGKLPRVAASRWAATQGTRGTARICSGGQEEVGEAGLEWTAWCLNCNQHSGSRLHEEGSHEFMGQDVVQGGESGRRGQVLLDEQRLPGSRDVHETGPS